MTFQIADGDGDALTFAPNRSDLPKPLVATAKDATMTDTIGVAVSRAEALALIDYLLAFLVTENPS